MESIEDLKTKLKTLENKKLEIGLTLMELYKINSEIAEIKRKIRKLEGQKFKNESSFAKNINKGKNRGMER